MPFRFALAPLLRLRHSVERQRALRLREKSLSVVRTQDSINHLEQFLARSAQSDQDALRAGSSAADLQFAWAARDNLHAFRQQMLADLGRFEIERQRAAEAYHRAYREREALESLWVSERRRYQQEASRRQQRAIDDTHLLRRWRNRGD